MTAGPRRPEPVRPDVYSNGWCAGMGGLGSNELFVQSGGKLLRPRLAYALDLADLSPGLKVLDIGCGRGEIVIKCAQAGAALAAGIDYAPVSLEQTAQNARAMGFEANAAGSPLALRRGDAKNLPFPDASFDRVFMLDVVEHLHEWELEKVWAEAGRVLAPRGYLVVHTLPNRWAVDYGYRLARLVLRRLPVKAPDQSETFHVNEQSPPSLMHSLTRAGLKRHVWLHDLLIAQARWWQKTRVSGEESQELVYRFLTRPTWRRLYRLAARLPSRLFLVTDLFALAWRDGPRPRVAARLPQGRSERIASVLAGKRPWTQGS